MRSRTHTFIAMLGLVLTLSGASANTAGSSDVADKADTTVDGFASGGGLLAAAADPGFSDVDPNSVHEENIAILVKFGVTLGCAEGLFCPSDPVTRGQMASFLARGFGTPVTGADFFVDDSTSGHEANINSVASVGITQECGGTNYCPQSSVTRGQVASFLARTLSLPTTATDYFADDNGSTHEININVIAEAGITLGCTTSTYCPNDPVSRAQMASLIARAFEYMGCEC